MIQKENLGLVHHMTLFGCYDSLDREHQFNANKTGFDCSSDANMPGDLQSCKTLISGWAVGGGVSTLLCQYILQVCTLNV